MGKTKMANIDNNGEQGRLQKFLAAVYSGRLKDIKRHLSLLELKDDDMIRDGCIQAIHILIERHDFPDVIDDILQCQLFKKKKARLILEQEIPHFLNTAAQSCRFLDQLRGFLSTMLMAIEFDVTDDMDILGIHDKDGLSALHLAVIDGNLKATNNLLDVGIDCQHTTVDGNTSLSLAIATNQTDIVSLLLPLSDVNTRDMDGDTPLMYAAWRRQSGLVLELIEAGADVNAESIHGTTALWNAVFRSCPETVRTLLQHNARMDVSCEGTYLFRTQEDDNDSASSQQQVKKIYRGHKRSLLWVAADRIQESKNDDKSMNILLTLLESGYDVTRERWLRNVIHGNIPKKYPQAFATNKALRDVLYFFHIRPQSLKDICRGVLRNHFTSLKGQSFSDQLSCLHVGETACDFLSLSYLPNFDR